MGVVCVDPVDGAEAAVELVADGHVLVLVELEDVSLDVGHVEVVVPEEEPGKGAGAFVQGVDLVRAGVVARDVVESYLGEG